MTATAHTAPHFYRPYHPIASSHGDASYSPMHLDRSRRAEGHARKSSEIATATMRDREDSTGHFRPRSDAQVFVAAPVTPPSSVSSSPRELRTSLAHLCHPSPTPSLRASMSFNNPNATSTWGSSSARSPSSSVSPPASRVRHEERLPVDSGKEASGRDSERSADEDLLTIARRGLLMDPVRPLQTIHPRASMPPDDAHAYVPPRERLVYRQRQASWSPERGRPTLPSVVQLQLPRPIRPAYPEFVQGSSRPSFSGAHRCGDTASPPPSPSPSTSSFSTNAPSGGRTDTEPTDEDEHVFIKSEPQSVKLPPLQLLRPEELPRSPTQLPYHPVLHSSVEHSAATSPLSSSPCASPELPFHHGGETYAFSACVSDVRTRLPVRGGELPSLPSLSPTWTTRQYVMASRGRPALPQHPRSTPDASPVDPVLVSPTPKKYRFVVSKPQLAAAQQSDASMERSDAIENVALASGTKRRYANASPASSVDMPLAQSIPDDEEGPRKRGPRQQPFDIGLFPASESGGRVLRGPRGAIVPAYHYDTERALQCAFPGCGTVLSGKKSETASHMRSHFLEASGETLHCPWPVETDDGQRVRCAMAFKDSANFGRHVSSKHIKAEEYQCNRCGRPFARRDAALRHMKTLCRIDAPQTSRRKGGEKRKTRTKVEDDAEHDECWFDTR